MLLKHKLNDGRITKYYFGGKKINKNTKKDNKEPEELRKIKRKLNIHMYTNEQFLKKFGLEMYKFLGYLNSAKDEGSYNKFLEIIKRTDVQTTGRKILFKNKRL